MGNHKLSMFGSIVCEFYFGKRKVIHKIFILPDEESVVPLLIGRDLLMKLNIYLCQRRTILSYNRNELLKMNLNNNKPNNHIISALMFLNLYRCPRKT